MTDFTQQIHRIKEKLALAKKADEHFYSSGAASHKYVIAPPVSTAEVEAFEERYDIRLPECYRSFVLNIGNGGISSDNSGAGPYYGIYPLGQNLDDLMIFRDVEPYLKKKCLLFPGMSKEQWDKLTRPLNWDRLTHPYPIDENYEELNGTILGGILPLGSQGCGYIHALVLNGPYQGKVVNMDSSRKMEPRFWHGENFLDWYEQWLDEIISGKDVTWYGYP